MERFEENAAGDLAVEKLLARIGKQLVTELAEETTGSVVA